MQGIRHGTALVLALVSWTPSASFSQDVNSYPTKSVRVITSQAQGGATDVQARMYAQKLSQELRRQFIVENLPGAGGITGIGAVARSAPDGHTLLTITSTFTITPALRKDLPFDPIKDFTPISLLSRAPYWLVVNASVPAKSVKELIALARAQPGKLNFGAGNIGSGTHLAVLYFFLQAKIKGTYVPYKGVGQATIDLLGGQIDGTFSGPLSMAPHVKSGKLRALGMTTAQRSNAYPDMPTIVEQGVDFVFITFHGWLAPAGTPAGVVNKLSAELAKAVNSPEIADKLKAEGVEPVGSSPEELRQIIASEVPRWRKLIQDTGIRPE